MISPSGVKMKREVTERHLKTPEGNALIKYDVKWKPVASQNGILMNQGDEDVFYPQDGQRMSNNINKVILSRTPSPHRQRRQTLPEKPPIPQKSQKLAQQNQPKGGYPIEDPRNPFHQEYLKLKALYDGKSGATNSSTSGKNIVIQPPKPKYQPPKLVVKRISGQSSKQESLKNPSLQQKALGIKGVFKDHNNNIIQNNEGNRTLKKIYNPHAAPTEQSASRPATIIIETPISNSSTPLKIQPNLLLQQNQKGYEPIRTNLMNEYHYCDDCDVAFQPYGNKPEDDLSYYDDHSGHSARRIQQIPYNANLPNNTTKTSFVQKSLKDGEGYSRAVQSQTSGKNVSPYTPPAYSPDKDHFQGGNMMNYPQVYHNENFNDMNVIGNNPYHKAYGEQQQRPQLVRSTKRPQFIGNQLNYQPLREMPYDHHNHQYQQQNGQ